MGRAPVGRSPLPESHVEQAPRGPAPERVPLARDGKGDRMSQRLRPRDLAFLAEESPSHADAQRDRRDLRARRLRLRLRAPGRADRRPDLVRAALPAAGAVRARPAGQPGLGRRPALRPRLPRTPVRAAAAGQPRPAARARRPDRLATARPEPPAVGGLLRRGARRRPGRGAVEVAPGPGRRRRHRRPRAGAARQGRGAAEPRRRRLDSAAAAVVGQPGGRGGQGLLGPPDAWCSTPCAPTPALCSAAPSGGQPGRGGRRRAVQPPLARAPRRSRARCRSSVGSSPYAPTSRPTARSARRTAAPSTTSSWRPSPARCAPG